MLNEVFFQLILNAVKRKKIGFYFFIILISTILLLRIVIGLGEIKYRERKISNRHERGKNIRS